MLKKYKKFKSTEKLHAVDLQHFVPQIPTVSDSMIKVTSQGAAVNWCSKLGNIPTAPTVCSMLGLQNQYVAQYLA